MKTVILPPTRRHLRSTTRIKVERVLPRKLLRRVLVAIDFSPASWQAFKFVLPFLKQLGAEVHLVHVFATDSPLAGMVSMPLILSDLEIERAAYRHLAKGCKKSGFELRAENVHAVKGRPFQQICALARKLDIGFIVISTRGLSGLRHFALGSTAERVVRYAPCPVLVVRLPNAGRSRNGNGYTPHAALRIRKILVPIDFSDCSHRGLDYAKRLAKKFRASLILLHSVYFQYHVSSDEFARYDYPLLVQEADKAARIRMRELVQETESDGFKVEPLLETGHVGEQICERARSHGADLIVTSTHGWTGFKHVLLDSTAEYVVQHAHSPVLVVPTHDRAEASSKER